MWKPKYTEEQKEFVRQGWAANKSTQTIADDFAAAYGIETSRRAIIGLASRLKLPRRANTGPWRTYPHKPPQVIGPKIARPAKVAPPQLDAVEPVPIGPKGDFPDAGGCKWVMSDLPEFQCCGHACYNRGPYCSHHAAKCRGAQPKQMVGTSRSDRSFGF